MTPKQKESNLSWQILAIQRKAQAEAFKEQNKQLLEVLKEAYKELQFHNWHNTTTGMLIERTIKKAE